MSILDGVMEKVETKILASLGDRLEIVTDFDPKKLILTTTTYWDSRQINENVFDLQPMVTEIIKRFKKA